MLFFLKLNHISRLYKQRLKTFEQAAFCQRWVYCIVLYWHNAAFSTPVSLASQNVLVLIAKCICQSFKIYLSKFQSRKHFVKRCVYWHNAATATPVSLASVWLINWFDMGAYTPVSLFLSPSVPQIYWSTYWHSLDTHLTLMKVPTNVNWFDMGAYTPVHLSFLWWDRQMWVCPRYMKVLIDTHWPVGTHLTNHWCVAFNILCLHLTTRIHNSSCY